MLTKQGRIRDMTIREYISKGCDNFCIAKHQRYLTYQLSFGRSCPLHGCVVTPCLTAANEGDSTGTHELKQQAWTLHGPEHQHHQPGQKLGLATSGWVKHCWARQQPAPFIGKITAPKGDHLLWLKHWGEINIGYFTSFFLTDCIHYTMTPL